MNRRIVGLRRMWWGHIVVGYTRTEPNKYRGLVLRCQFSEPPYVFVEDITGNIPNLEPPFLYHDAPPPMLSVSSDPNQEKILITGGYGLILFSSDGGNSWYPPATHPNPEINLRLSDWYNSSYWTPFFWYSISESLIVCADNSGIVARSTNVGITWQVGSQCETYNIPSYGTYNGRVLPLSATKDFCAMADGYVAKWAGSEWFFTRIHNRMVDPPTDENKRWFWFHSCQYTPYLQNRYHIVGSDGCIARVDPDNPGETYWERYPRNDSFYTLNAVDHGVFDPVGYVAHAFGSKGQSLIHYYNPSNLDPISPPQAPSPGPCQNLDMVYNGVYGGYDLYWDPPSNYESAKVGGYWICPPEGPRWIANLAPVPRTTYFIPWPTGQYLNARVLAMNRKGICGQWTELVWKCTIEKEVERDATGANNGARNLILDNQGRLWAFYGKEGNIYATYSTNNGDNWAIPVNIGQGDIQASAINGYGRPMVIIIKNIPSPSPGWSTGQLYVTYLATNGWTEPQLVREKSKILG